LQYAANFEMKLVNFTVIFMDRSWSYTLASIHGIIQHFRAIVYAFVNSSHISKLYKIYIPTNISSPYACIEVLLYIHVHWRVQYKYIHTCWRVQIYASLDRSLNFAKRQSLHQMKSMPAEREEFDRQKIL
jgi:hypothetical protein